MLTFPQLSSGAVTQYPLRVTTGQATQVLRFLDGSDQRFRAQGGMLRQWQIKVELLNEDELEALESFFQEQSGDYSTFVFPDPYSGSGVLNCRFGSPVFTSAYEGVDSSATAFWVIETYG